MLSWYLCIGYLFYFGTCGLAACGGFLISQPDGHVSGHWAVPLSLAEGSGDRREPVPGATNLRLKFQDSNFKFQGSRAAVSGFRGSRAAVPSSPLVKS